MFCFLLAACGGGASNEQPPAPSPVVVQSNDENATFAQFKQHKWKSS